MIFIGAVFFLGNGEFPPTAGGWEWLIGDWLIRDRAFGRQVG